MQTFLIVERKVLVQALFQLRDGPVLVQVDMLIFDCAPEPFHEHVVERAPTAIHTDALQQLGRFLDQVYEYKRIHSSLGYLTTAEFEDQWQREQALAHDVH